MVGKRKGFLKSKGGFTLIEFLFSLVVFATVMTGTLAALQGAQRFSEDSRQKLLAMHAARGVLETIKNTDFEGLDNINTANFVPAAFAPFGGIAMECSSATVDPNFVANSCAAVSASNDPLATITVFVYWAPAGSTRANACTLADNNGCRSLQATTMRSAF